MPANEGAEKGALPQTSHEHSLGGSRHLDLPGILLVAQRLGGQGTTEPDLQVLDAPV